MARRSKQTDGRVMVLLNALKAGNTRRAAAAYAEIDHSTFYRWLEADATFRDSVEKAEADAEVRYASIVAKAATDGTWQAAAWWLERRRAQDFARSEKVEMTGKDGGPIDHRDITTLPDHEREALAEAIRRHLRGSEQPEGSAPVAGEG